MRDLCSSLTRRIFALQDSFFQDVVEFLFAIVNKAIEGLGSFSAGGFLMAGTRS
jgi:hypothetical protein